MNFLFAISTTIGMTIVPLLVTDKLGFSLFILGFIEGGTEFISNILRLMTGNIFDRIKNKKVLFVIPVGFAFFSKVILLIPTAYTILTSKITERIANGTFAVPRDAYIGLKAEDKGKAMGWLNVSKTAGCILGPITVSISSILIGSLQQNIYITIILACLLNCINFYLSFKINSDIHIKIAEKFEKSDLKFLIIKLKFILLLSFIFFLGRFNDGIIMLHLKNEGFPEWFYLTTISIFNVVMLITSPIVGHYMDKNKTNYVLIVTIIALWLFNIIFSMVKLDCWVLALLGLICWGIQRTGAQIVFSVMIFKKVSEKYYGTAIGIFSLLSGFAVFISSLISGYIAQYSFNNVFLFSSICSLLVLGLAATYIKHIK